MAILCQTYLHFLKFVSKPLGFNPMALFVHRVTLGLLPKQILSRLNTSDVHPRHLGHGLKTPHVHLPDQKIGLLELSSISPDSPHTRP